MGVGARLPGVILLLAAVVLLALVSFNVPMLKGFYFLEGKFTSGSFKGTLRLGTLGYCATGDVEECVGPKIGYSFDLNTILGIPKNLINIPSAVSKYLTYVLVAHIIALCFAAIGFAMALLDLIPGCNMVCFPTCMASIAASITLIAFIFDLAIFFIAKTAIGKASGAEATIGPAVWMTLAAWVCCTVSICAFGMANCCCGCGSSSRDRESRRDRKRRKRDDEDSFDDYRRDNDMRMHAIRDEERRKYEQDLPSFQPYEREPLNRTPPEDKYLYDETPPVAAQGGTGVNGVGVGYGPRNPYAAAAPVAYGQNLAVQRQPSTGSSMLTAGNAGVGAGGEGVDQPRNQYGYAGQREQMADSNYYDPYASTGPSYEYAQAAGNPVYPPVAAAGVASPSRQRSNDYFSGGPGSSDSHYRDPGPRVQQADPYQSTPYDDGLGAIGRAATSPTGEQQYTGAQGYGGGYGGAATPAPLSIPTANAVQVPTPQRLVNPTHSSILQSPESDYSTAAAFNMPESDAPGPPSYGQATHNAPVAASLYPQEKR